jgi:hypothetical protein
MVFQDAKVMKFGSLSFMHRTAGLRKAEKGIYRESQFRYMRAVSGLRYKGPDRRLPLQRPVIASRIMQFRDANDVRVSFNQFS